MTSSLVFKVATESSELEQIHRLNYATFVEEIPQHTTNEPRRLVDRFDAENTYFVCKRGERVIGMMAVRANRPFSLDAKLPDLDRYLPPGRVCEVRLLAVDRGHRNGVVFRGLLRAVVRDCIARGITGAVISGTVRQLRLYEHMGFVPFGPLVGKGDALFQPMSITLEAMLENDRAVGAIQPEPALSFLPGPVDLHPEVWSAFTSAPASHRSDEYLAELIRTRKLLRALTGAEHVAILAGSGTLANDVVAAQLSIGGGKGLVLVNGEFGERLVDHARRAGLHFAVERIAWGDVFDGDRIAAALRSHQDVEWCWLVHHETSTGVLNDLSAARRLSRLRGIRLCADCVSSVGMIPVDLRDVHLATSVSGKALGAIAGLSIVFHQGDVQRSERLPRYLDLALYADTHGVPFTQPSGLLRALRVATEHAIARGDMAGTRALAHWLREQLCTLELHPLAPADVAAPGIVTITPPDGQSSRDWGDELAHRGFAVSYRSCYLLERNWLQIAIMGECSRQKLEPLLTALRRLRWRSEPLRFERVDARGEQHGASA